ncbi:restriction endonuclease subunit S [Burkholderia vietnamiensis]|uniref:restriction endonuclease subunit S n=1 Tax=Burkholderia vietnamiensis TaxID=60552 RepID=UPI001ABA6976|nr:restriction endonuclease subunit S [Burkholderia vietnamiensis]
MSWQRKRLGEIADLCLGKMLDQKKNRGEMLPYLANVNVRWGVFDLDDLRQMPFELHESERYGLKFGDIVMCEGGEPGRCAIWKDNVPGMMIQKALHRIRPGEAVDHRFLYYSFLLKGKNGEFAGLFTGSTIKHLTGQNLAKVEIAFPSKPDQEKIAGMLSAYDDLIENNRRRIELLEQSARLLHREWFVHLRFPGHEHVRVVDGVPEGWSRIPLGEALTLQRGFDLPANDRQHGEIPVYAATGIHGLHNKAMVHGPGVITGRSGSLGKVLYSPRDFWPLNTTLWVKEFKRVTPEFAYFLLAGLGLAQFNGGAAVPTLNRNDVHRIEILLPPKNWIDEFTQVALLQLSQIDKLSELNIKLNEARDLLLPRLMTGELAV